MADKKFNGRVLTSLILTCAFLVMAISGIIAYIMPHGRIAYWTDWHFWGLTKDQWANMHIIASLLFLTAGGFHIYFKLDPAEELLHRQAQGLPAFRPGTGPGRGADPGHLPQRRTTLCAFQLCV